MSEDEPFEIPAWLRRQPQKTTQDIVDDVYRGAAAGGMTRANARHLLADTPATSIEPSPETQAECRRLFGKGWD